VVGGQRFVVPGRAHVDPQATGCHYGQGRGDRVAHHRAGFKHQDNDGGAFDCFGNRSARPCAVRSQHLCLGRRLVSGTDRETGAEHAPGHGLTHQANAEKCDGEVPQYRSLRNNGARYVFLFASVQYLD
jgi:hypothetical protein